MKINSIEHLGYLVSVNKADATKSSGKKAMPKKDQLEISSQAKSIKQAKPALTPERLELIKQRIAEKFYDQEDVLKVVADRVLKSKEFNEFLNNSGFDKSF